MREIIVIVIIVIIVIVKGNVLIIWRQSSMGSKPYRLAQISALFWPFVKVVNIEG